MAEGLGSSIESLVGQSHLRELLPQCCQDPSADVRQSAFALVGDLSRVCAPHLQPVIKQLLALAIQNMEARCINPQNMSACNNACWSMGRLLCCIYFRVRLHGVPSMKAARSSHCQNGKQ